MTEQITKNFLADLFLLDGIRNGASLRKLKEIGGYRGLAEALETDLKKGIRKDPKDRARRIARFEDNAPIKKHIKSLWEHISEALEDKILRILCFAAVVSTFIGIFEHGWKEGWMEGAGILLAVVAIVCVTAGNNYAKDKQFQKLYEQVEKRSINVIRNGNFDRIEIYELLVGDIIQIETGEILPVDGVVIQANNLKADESSMTGESDMIEKKVPKTFNEKKLNCFLISGSKINEGTGQMLVLTVGKNTVFGKIQKNLQQEEDETPLQQKLAVLADLIGKVGVWCALVTFGAMTIHLFIELIITKQEFFTMYVFQCFLDHFIVAITVIVVAVPEGLPLAVTIALAYSVGKMKDQNNLVRVLTACETMGGCDNICSDKTGTLTQNQMTVVSMFCQQKNLNGKLIPKQIIDPTDPKKKKRMTSYISVFDKKEFNQNVMDIMAQCACINSDCLPTIYDDKPFIQNGNKTECALVELVYRLDPLKYKYTNYRPSDKIIQTIPFSSTTKSMSVIYELDRTVARMYTKGAWEKLLPLCSHFLDYEGIKRIINEDFKKELERHAVEYSNNSYRTLLLAYKDMPNNHSDKYEDSPDEKLVSNLTVITLVGIQDPLREGIIQAVKECDIAGVNVRMVTGDISDTAIAIAKNAGILPKDYIHPEELKEKVDDHQDHDHKEKQVSEENEGSKREQSREEREQKRKIKVLTGQQFRDRIKDAQGNILIKVPAKEGTIEQVSNIEEFARIAKDLKVLARSTPEDKYILVTGLKQLQHSVAVTGDGTNDAPALKKADVGFAMGIAGTQVAQNAAKIILMDDNFASIVTAILWGRNIFDCIRKFLQFQLTINVVAIIMTFIGGITIRETPLITIQMLWINLIMDTLASLALATEPPNPELLQRKPYRRTDSIITLNMWRNILGQAVFQLAVCNVMLFYGDKLFNVPSGIHVDNWTYELGQHKTIYFSVFVFMQVFNEINARKLKRDEYNVFEGFFNNPMFLAVIIGTIIMHFFLVEYGGKVMQTTPLSYEIHGITLLIGLGSLVNGFIIKLIPNCCFDWIPFFKNIEEENLETRVKKGALDNLATMKTRHTIPLKPKSIEESSGPKVKNN